MVGLDDAAAPGGWWGAEGPHMVRARRLRSRGRDLEAVGGGRSVEGRESCQRGTGVLTGADDEPGLG